MSTSRVAPVVFLRVINSRQAARVFALPTAAVLGHELSSVMELYV